MTDLPLARHLDRRTSAASIVPAAVCAAPATRPRAKSPTPTAATETAAPLLTYWVAG